MGDSSALRSIERSVVASAPVRSPVRLLLPPITAAVIDIVVGRCPLRSCGSGQRAPWPG